MINATPPARFGNQRDLLFRHLPKLPRLLESDDVNMRIAAGETIALLFELARDMDCVSLNPGFLVFLGWP